MRFLVGAMMVVFALGGLALFVTFFRELAGKVRARRRFERALGTIESVRRKVLTGTGKSPMKATVMHFPTVAFTTRSGEPVTFTSETGDAGDESRYERGQQLPVLYDPVGEYRPMIDTWSGFWLPSLMGMLAGVVCVFGSFLIYVAFGDKILGR